MFIGHSRADAEALLASIEGPERLSGEQLRLITQRFTQASPGPWTAFIEADGGLGGCDVIRVSESDEEPDLYLWFGGDLAPSADFRFVAAAREELPAAITVAAGWLDQRDPAPWGWLDEFMWVRVAELMGRCATATDPYPIASEIQGCVLDAMPRSIDATSIYLILGALGDMHDLKPEARQKAEALMGRAANEWRAVKDDDAARARYLSDWRYDICGYER
jgi:hypothetical protein